MRLGEQKISTWRWRLHECGLTFVDGSMNDLLRVWPLKRGSQSLALASRVALILLFITQLLCARLGSQAPPATVPTGSESETLGKSSYFGKLRFPFEVPTSAAYDSEERHVLSPSGVRVPSIAFREFSFFSPFLYQQLSLCRWPSPPPPCPSVRQSGVRMRYPPSRDFRRRRCADPRSNIRSAFLNFIFAPFPSLVLVSATRVRLGTGHAHHMEHGAFSGALQPEDSSPTTEEESDEDEDAVLTQEQQAEEDECAAQSAVQAMLEADFSGNSNSVMATSHQWLRLKDVLMRRMANKKVCTPARSSEQLCRVPPAEDSNSGEASGGRLPCGGTKYEQLIEKFVDERNCLAAMAMSHTLSQGWLGLPHTDEASELSTGGAETSITSGTAQDKAEHSLALAARGGLLGILISQYHQAIDSGVLDSALSSVYSAAAQLLTDFKAAAVEGLNAFNSLELRDALQLRRTQQVAILCSLGEGKKADLGSSVLSGDNALIVRVNTEGHDQATVKAFIDAVGVFSKFVKSLLEDGGFVDRAIEVHREFYKFRFEKMQVLMQEVEPSTLVHTSNTLLNALPLEKHKKFKTKHKSHGQAGEGSTDSGGGHSTSSAGAGETASFPQLFAAESTTSLPGRFLQLVAEQRDAFKQPGESIHHGKTVEGTRENLPSFLQHSAELTTSELLPLPLPYGALPASAQTQQPSSFLSAVPPLMQAASPPAAVGGAQGFAAPGQQPVAVSLSASAPPLGMQQLGGLPVQTASVGAPGALTTQWTVTQPPSPTPYVAGPQQQQPQQLQQEPRQQPLQGTLQQVPVATQQPQPQQQPPQQLLQPQVALQQPPQQQPPQQQPPQQQPPQQQPAQQQQPPQLQPPQQQPYVLAQPVEQGQPLQQQQGQPLAPPQQQQMQNQTRMQQFEYGGGASRSPQEDHARQQGEGQHSEGAVPGAVGQGGLEGSEESKAGHDHQGGVAGHGGFPPHGKGVPLKQKIKAVMSRLRMFKMEKEELLFEPNEPAIDKIVRAGYLEPSDRVIVAWGALLPQAAVTTAAELITMMLPIPEVDMALFYNKTLHDGGQITDGYDGSLPVDDKLITERFSVFIDETYRQCWRIFFAKNDNLVGEASSPPPPPAAQQQQQQQPWNAGISSNSGISALQLAGGAEARLSLAAEIEELTKASRSVTRAAVASLQEQQQQQHSRTETQVKSGDGGGIAVSPVPKTRGVHGDATALAEVHQHASAPELEGNVQSAGGRPRVTVTFVESSDGLSVSDMQSKFVNELYVNKRTVEAMSGASLKSHVTVLPAAASAAVALIFALFLVDL